MSKERGTTIAVAKVFAGIVIGLCVPVIGGIIALGNVVLRTWNETSSDEELNERKNIVRSVGWYWHFMGALWLALVLLLGLYK